MRPIEYDREELVEFMDYLWDNTLTVVNPMNTYEYIAVIPVEKVKGYFKERIVLTAEEAEEKFPEYF